jgi:hypothetical protein
MDDETSGWLGSRRTRPRRADNLEATFRGLEPRPPATDAAQAAPGFGVFAFYALHDEGQALESTPDDDGAFKNRVPKGGTRIERWNGRPACGCEMPHAPPWLPTFEPP